MGFWMARKKSGYWTEERLMLLEELFHKIPRNELCMRFGKTYEALMAVYDYRQTHKTLLISQKVKKTKTGEYTITIYAAAFADGVSPQRGGGGK